MYQAGDVVVYESTGVCRVELVGTAPEIPVAARDKWYYQLSPVYGSGTIYVPVDGKAFIRPVISREEALDLIDKIPDIRDDTYQHCEQRQLENCYRESIRSHQCEDLVGLVKALYAKNRAMTRAGKRLGRVDQEYRKRAEELLHGELAAALDIPYEQVADYIAGRVAELTRA